MISVESLSKRFGETLAVDDLSFVARPGHVTGFLGPNGAGKTTTLRAIVGLIAPSAGTTLIDGRPYAQLRRPTTTVGAVLDRAGYHPKRSGRNHLRVLAELGRLPASRVEEVLEVVELKDAADRKVDGYSLGMKQRLGLAAALLGDPRVLILDEPANGLDPQGMRWLRDLLRSLADDGRTVLISSHVLAEVGQTVDEVVVINHGKLLSQTTLEGLTGSGSGRTSVRSPNPESLLAALEREGVPTDTREDGSIEAAAPPQRVGEIAAAAGIVLHELTTAGSNLEEVYLELTGEARPG